MGDSPFETFSPFESHKNFKTYKTHINLDFFTAFNKRTTERAQKTNVLRKLKNIFFKEKANSKNSVLKLTRKKV